MINFFENLRISIGMDTNTFYPMLITLISIVVPFVVAIAKSIKGRFENNLFDLHCKKEGDFFFGWVLLCDAILATAVLFVYIIIHAILKYLWMGYDNWGIVVYIVLVLGATLFLSKRVFVRKRLLDKKWCKGLIYLPIFIFSIVFYGAFRGVDNAVLSNTCGVILVVLEVIGMWQFRGRYVQYRYSSAIFYLNNGDVIDCKDISKIARKFNSLIIQEDNEQTRFKYGDISRVRYYGECMLKILEK